MSSTDELREWWSRYERDVGTPDERPESYWTPRIAEVCHLRPVDIGGLTPSQLHAAYVYSDPPK